MRGTVSRAWGSPSRVSTSANMPGRRVPPGLGRVARTVTVRVPSSMPESMAVTVPWKDCPGMASTRVRTDWPTRTRLNCVSGTA